MEPYSQPNEQPPKSAGSWVSVAAAAAGVGAFFVALWQAMIHHGWISVLVAVLSFSLVIAISYIRRPALRLWLVTKLQTTEMVARYENTVKALTLRGKVLGAGADFAKWTTQFIATGDHASALSFFDRMNHAFLDTIRDVFPQVERIALFVPDDANEEFLCIAYSARFDPDRSEAVRLPVSQSAAGHAYASGTRYFTSCLSQETNAVYYPLPESREIETLLCLPIQSTSQIFGVLSVDSRSPNVLDQDTIELIETLCTMLAVSWTVRDRMMPKGGIIS